MVEDLAKQHGKDAADLLPFLYLLCHLMDAAEMATKQSNARLIDDG